MKLKYFLFTALSFCLVTSYGQNTEKKAALRPVPVEDSNSPKFRTSAQPMTATTRMKPKKGGIRGNDILGEGRYLHFDKKIMSYSVTGEIPEGFPKHIKGQSREEYMEVMDRWALAHPEHFIEPGDYLDYDDKIKERSINGEIPDGFPKYVKGQTRKEYIQVMKQWGMDNLEKFKEEYRTPKNQ